MSSAEVEISFRVTSASFEGQPCNSRTAVSSSGVRDSMFRQREGAAEANPYTVYPVNLERV